MKSIFKYIPFVLLFVLMSFTEGDKKTMKITTTFWVASVCGECESIIEKAMDVKGVVAADYVMETQKLTVTYKSNKITEDQLHVLLNEAGYDTEKSKCTEEQYLRTPGCCRYRTLEKH